LTTALEGGEGSASRPGPSVGGRVQLNCILEKLVMRLCIRVQWQDFVTAVMNLQSMKIQYLDQLNNYQLLTHDPPPYICQHYYKHDLYFEIVYYISDFMTLVYYITDFMTSKAQLLDIL